MTLHLPLYNDTKLKYGSDRNTESQHYQKLTCDNCKHKHMMKSGAPPDKFIVMYLMVTYKILWFHKQN